jgi:hypothetical protein
MDWGKLFAYVSYYGRCHFGGIAESPAHGKILFIFVRSFQSNFLIGFSAPEDLSGHRYDPPTVDNKVGSDKKGQGKTGPVMDIAHKGEGKHQFCKPECPHEEGKLEETGNNTDEK